MTLSNDNITLEKRITFAAVLILLVAVTAYFIQQHYYDSIRGGMIPVEFLVGFATPDFDFQVLPY
ncbi:MAG: hypothetical protein GEU26_18710 [Nitrososphaeraceae archaeon]|nr:hypothetical protein [Nitrososphaeraceae archaeon]